MENTKDKLFVKGGPGGPGRAFGDSDLFREAKDGIIESIRARVPYAVAAEANGVREGILYSWLRKGFSAKRDGKPNAYTEFAQAIKKIEQEKITEHLNAVNATPERWQAHAWILERRWWKHFSPQAALIEMNKRLDAMDSDEDLDSDDVK